MALEVSAETRNPIYQEGANGTGSQIDAFLLVKGGPAAIALPTALTDVVYGVTATDIPDGEVGDVQIAGSAPVLAGTGGVSEGARVTIEINTGKVIAWAPGAGANAAIVGICEKAATADKIATIRLAAGQLGQGA